MLASTTLRAAHLCGALYALRGGKARSVPGGASNWSALSASWSPDEREAFRVEWLRGHARGVSALDKAADQIARMFGLPPRGRS